MKKLLFILLLVFALNVSAQNQNNWITDYTIALKQSETQNKPILAYVTNNQITEASKLLESYLSNDSFQKLMPKLVLLKLDVSDQNSTNARLGIHYTKQTSAPGLALVDKNGKTLFQPLVEMNDENMMLFLTLLHDKLR